MYETSVYLGEGAHESLYLQGLDVLKAKGVFIEIDSLFGEKERIRARVIACSLVDHQVTLEAISEA
jgi:hypothetical protein